MKIKTRIKIDRKEIVVGWTFDSLPTFFSFIFSKIAEIHKNRQKANCCRTLDSQFIAYLFFFLFLSSRKSWTSAYKRREDAWRPFALTDWEITFFDDRIDASHARKSWRNERGDYGDRIRSPHCPSFVPSDLAFRGNFPDSSVRLQASVLGSFLFHDSRRKSNFKGCL